MHFAETHPDHPLIERIWFARGEGGRRETILPDGTYELVFNFGDPVTGQPMAMLVGETRRAVTVEPTGRIDLVGVRLRHGAAPAVLGAPLREVRDRMLDLRDIDAKLDLRERLAEQPSDEERADLILRTVRGGHPEPLATRAANVIVRRAGRLSISRLAQHLGVTIRTLSRAFDRAIGLTPKTLARVVRMNRAAALLRGGGAAADVALDTGFYDQSHLVNEFRALAGLSPARWLDLDPALAVHFLQDPRAISE